MKRLRVTLDTGEVFLLPAGYVFTLSKGPSLGVLLPAGPTSFSTSQLAAAEVVDDETPEHRYA
jgi:hypothetical protein